MTQGKDIARAAALLPLLAWAAACSSGTPQSTCGPAQDVVADVTDGDTITLAGGEKVRYLMVDTPETTKGHNDCYGAEASDFNMSLVLNQMVTLRYDKECRDVYGRLLAYVSVDGREVNTLLVERGYACVLHIPPNGDDRLDEFEALQAQAQADKRGVWGACDPVTCAN